MADRTWITVFFPTPLIFRYHLPLTLWKILVCSLKEKKMFFSICTCTALKIKYYSKRKSLRYTHVLLYCLGATSHIIDMVWLYRSRIPVGRRGFFYLFIWSLPAFAAPWGRGGRSQHPVGINGGCKDDKGQCSASAFSLILRVYCEVLNRQVLF